ncbi:hypothetical protein PR048_007408 [Dryococelus australis]|uniref:Uncharacterized protein n=1 Tax=Dryococelus australis TaxID=614101 RepID=A0ABQ9HU60_9NEOP|nr:hypothetical protein PR048_007408 [Dryococelus australis]
MKIPRRLAADGFEDTWSLHTFCDASQSAYEGIRFSWEVVLMEISQYVWSFQRQESRHRRILASCARRTESSWLKLKQEDWPKSEVKVNHNEVPSERRNLTTVSPSAKEEVEWYSMENTKKKKIGGQTCLSSEEESTVINGVITCSDWGYPITVLDLQMFTKYYLDSLGKIVPKFANNLTGVDWAYSMLKCHKSLIGQRSAREHELMYLQIT